MAVDAEELNGHPRQGLTFPDYRRAKPTGRFRTTTGQRRRGRHGKFLAGRISKQLGRTSTRPCLRPNFHAP